MLFYPGSFKVSAPTDHEVEIERDFNAPRPLVFDAFTKPELVRRWLLGPDGWTMPICEIDLRVDGLYRYVWRKESNGQEMGMGGVFRDVVRPEKLVATEKFDHTRYPGDAVNREIPSREVVQTVYKGAYEQLGNAWAEFNNWISVNAHRPGPDFYECYPVGPESSPNSADWWTELRRPLLGKARG
jgi:uncharacterized protein YndB with AHSA1/START domain